MRIEVINLGPEEVSSYNLMIYAVGYEERSRYLAQEYADRCDVRVGYYFSDGRIFSFEENDQYRKKIAAHVLPQGSSLVKLLQTMEPGRCFVGAKVLLDVSSLNRGAMASLLGELLEDDFFAEIQLTLAYSIAKFREPVDEEVQFLDFAPLDGFEGWTSNPELPAVLVLGLGYETDHAVGAVEFLDPSSTFCFFPSGNDAHFDTKVEEANKPLLEIINNDRVIFYPVMSPYQTYWQMYSLIHTIKHVARVILVPMGPKIFCSLCLVFQKAFGEEISVWRASGHTLENARDAVAQGVVVGYSVVRKKSL